MGSTSIVIASIRTAAEPVTVEDIDREIVRETVTNIVLNMFMNYLDHSGATNR